MRAILALVIAFLALGWAGGASASTWRGRYVVASGDTLTLIAKQHGVSLQRLANVNQLDWRKPLQVGTVLHVPLPPAKPSLPHWPGTYKVHPGDTLTLIAKQHGVSLQRLANVNQLDWRKPLQVGTVLHVPLPPAKPSLPHWPGTYKVHLGDTLGEIAARYKVSLGKLARENGLDPAAILLAGTKLHVPAPAPAPSITITVRAGDTLSGIATRYGVSLESLSALNGLDPASLLLVGQRLHLPAGANRPSSGPSLTMAEGNPYPHGASGIDVSYPNCPPTPAAGPGGAFAVVGLNGGRPFTANPCFDSQYAAATAAQITPSIYLNSAYSPGLLRHVTPECRAAATAQPLAPVEQQAYAVGCSTAAAAAPALASRPTAAIWIDVEPANTWSGDPAVNRATLQGLVDALLAWAPRPTVGVYSRTDYWRQITGGWHALTLPEWIAAGNTPDLSGCGAPFASGPVWLSQHTTDHDQDTAC